MTFYSILQTSLLGDLLLLADSTHLTGVYFSGLDHAPVVAGDWVRDAGQPVLRQASEELENYLDGKRTSFSVPRHYEGTSFQREIWKQIALIPFGETITYTELAERAGAPMALRAAGTATGKNPLSLVIPCHRVVGKDGGMGGYAGGLEKKKRLLAIETNSAAGRLFLR